MNSMVQVLVNVDCIHNFVMTLFPDCDDIVANGNLMSGVYEIWPAVYNERSVQVYCEISGGKGWIVLQRRQDGSTDFRRSWKDYEWG